ncbi:Hypothetical protein NocV09_12100080 [Nannochloropsis oceanica]
MLSSLLRRQGGQDTLKSTCRSSISSTNSSRVVSRPVGRRIEDLILPPRPRLYTSSSSSSDVHSPSPSSSASLHSPHDDDPYTFSGKAPRMLELVLVRHGQSEGNVAYRRSLAGDHSLYSGEFLRRHSSKWRLTDLGRQQAEIAGEWLRNEIPGKSFDRFYVSEYIRCMETAARLNIPDARWFAEVFLRERDWGHILVYTRINPETGEIAPNFRWMKSSCPWDPSLSPNRWEEINRAMYTNNMLLATAETVPRLISGIPDKVGR